MTYGSDSLRGGVAKQRFVASAAQVTLSISHDDADDADDDRSVTQLTVVLSIAAAAAAASIQNTRAERPHGKYICIKFYMFYSHHGIHSVTTAATSISLNAFQQFVRCFYRLVENRTATCATPVLSHQPLHKHDAARVIVKNKSRNATIQLTTQ